MNIFFLHKDPEECAKLHCDKHVVKMIVEYAQILSTAHRVLDGDTQANVMGLYRSTHINHPSTVWARSSVNNYSWLLLLFRECLDEYTKRYGKVHATSRLVKALTIHPTNIPISPFTSPPQCMPDYCRVHNSAIAAYRNYYIKEKSHMFFWKNRDIPEMFSQKPLPF